MCIISLVWPATGWTLDRGNATKMIEMAEMKRGE